MKIVLAMYLSGGRAVSHYKGEAGQATVLASDPVRSAQEFEREGLTALHIVDSDARIPASGSVKNRSMAKSIAAHTGLKISYADGMASIGDIEGLFADGIHYVSLDQFSEALLPEALKAYGSDKVFFTIQTLRHAIVGKPGLEVMDYGRDLVSRGVAKIILRDTKAEGSLHPNFDEVERLIIGTEAKVFAFGGVGSMDDLDILKRTGVSGVMISRAFFERKLSVRECVRSFESAPSP